jgi:hypothetical protein
MSHRDTINEVTENAAECETWEEAVTSVHQALQIVGVVLDELEQRVSALESARETDTES